MERTPNIFSKFPGLRSDVAWMPLGEYPTPVERLEGTGAALGMPYLFVKRDDLSSPLYGGNKVRKLEFLLADAREKGHRTVLTFGAAGSNHVVATVIHARRLGMETIAVLMPQPNALYVRKNLLLDLVHGARFVPTGSPAGEALGLLKGMFRGFDRGRFPRVIPPGGSNVLGTLGFIEGALELAAQIQDGVLPEPDFIFATYGSGSTAAGLLLGARIAGLRSEVVPVRVVDRFACNRYLLARHVNAAARFLATKGGGPVKGVHPRDILFVDDFAGPTYARFTPEAVEAVRQVRDLDSIELECTYTGKTFAAMLEFIRVNGLGRRASLFWNTYNSADLYPDVAGADYHLLPEELQVYFEEPVQEEEIEREAASSAARGPAGRAQAD